MKKLVLAVAFSVGFTGWFAPRSARADWTAENWAGRPLTRGGRFAGCVMEAEWLPDGRRFEFLQRPNFDLLIGLTKKNGAWPAGKEKILLQIDAEVIRTEVGIVETEHPNTLWINLGTDRGAREKLKSGYTMILHREPFPKATRSLKGTFVALTRLEECVKNKR